jgi:hypothetical protein
MFARRQQLKRRDLRRWVNAVQVAREAANGTHALGQVGVPDAGWQRCPAQCTLDGDGGCAGGIHELDEAAQRALLGDELEPEAAPDREVVVEVLLKNGHARASGHCWTRSASARRSTLA